MAKNIFKRRKAKTAMDESGERRNGNGAGGNGAQAEVVDEPTAPTGQPVAGAAQQPVLPLFYKSPQPVHQSLHAGKGLKEPIDYRFAAAAHAVVLHTQEFRLAAAHYPIVFSDDAQAMPLAVLGYRDGSNVFVDEEGNWAPGAYVPAYVRRYPFATGQGSKEDETILYVDSASDLVVDLEDAPGAQPFFVGDQPSERIKQAIEFCAAFQQQVPATTAFVNAVQEHNLLEAKEIKLELPGGGSQLLTGLRMIEEARFKALSDQVVLDWRRQGWIDFVYWHWASLDNFARMLARA